MSSEIDIVTNNFNNTIQTIDPKNYPVIRYVGSKYRLLEWIKNELSDLDYESVLDGFSGSGAVSYMFKTMNKKVYSNDFLHFSYIIAKATIENDDQKITRRDLELLLKKNEENDFIQNTFNKTFYTEEDLYCSPPGEISDFKLNLPILISVD